MPRGTGEGDNPKKLCLLPFEEWEKVAEGRMRALWPSISTLFSFLNKGLAEAQSVTYL